MKKTFQNTAVILFGLIVGFILWKVISKPLPVSDSVTDHSSTSHSSASSQQEFPTLQIGPSLVSSSDIAWEFDLHTSLPNFVDSDEHFGLPPVDPSKTTPDKPAGGGLELKERIITSIIERKILYHYIQGKDVNFSLDDPARFSQCLSQVNAVSKENEAFFSKPQSRERLKSKLCEESIVEQYLQEQIFSGVSVSSEEIKAYYRKNEKTYKKPLRVVLKQIVVANEPLAQSLRKEVKPNNFTEFAVKHSITPEGKNGGLVGPFSKEQLPTLFDIVFSMPIGEISGVVKSEYGFHIIMPVERIPAQTQPLSEVTPAIRRELLRLRKLDEYQRVLNLAMNAVSVTSPQSSGVGD